MSRGVDVGLFLFFFFFFFFFVFSAGNWKLGTAQTDSNDSTAGRLDAPAVAALCRDGRNDLPWLLVRMQHFIPAVIIPASVTHTRRGRHFSPLYGPKPYPRFPVTKCRSSS